MYIAIKYINNGKDIKIIVIDETEIEIFLNFDYMIFDFDKFIFF